MVWNKFFSIAVGLFITAVLVSLAVYALHGTKDVIQYSEKQNRETAEAWGESDLLMLASKDVTGVDVINYTRKYKSGIAVIVTTLDGMQKSYSDATPIVNEPGSKGYVEPGAIFTTELEYTVNGDVKQLSFTQKGVVTVDSIKTLEDAKEALVNGSYSRIAATDDWESIARIVSDLCRQDSSAVKGSLATMLGGSYSDRSSWTELGAAAVERLRTDKQSNVQNDANSVGVKISTVTLMPGVHHEFIGDPYLVVCTDVLNGEKQVFQGGTWYVDGVLYTNSLPSVVGDDYDLTGVHTKVFVDGRKLINFSGDTLECITVLK